jgi:hypothetical protein
LQSGEGDFAMNCIAFLTKEVSLNLDAVSFFISDLCSVIISSEVPVRPIPFSINALEYDGAQEIDNILHHDVNCPDPKGGTPHVPDAQTTKDEKCLALGPCHIAFTHSREYVVSMSSTHAEDWAYPFYRTNVNLSLHSSSLSMQIYEFSHSVDHIVDLKDGGKVVFVDITVRVASLERKYFYLEVFDGDKSRDGATFLSPGKGFQAFEDVTWRKIAIDPYETRHSVQVYFFEGNTNLCSVTVEYSRQKPAITWGALDYFDSSDNSLHSELGGCNPRDDGVDAQPTLVRTVVTESSLTRKVNMHDHKHITSLSSNYFCHCP